jgi:solute carrier family 25, member 38
VQQGTSVAILRMGFGAGLYFNLLNLLLPHGQREAGKVSNTQLMIAGSGARILVGAFSNPISVVKTRFEAAHSGSVLRYDRMGIFGTAKHIVRNEGFTTLYSGLAPTLVRDVPYAGLYFVMYNRLKALFPDPGHPASQFVAGAMASGIGTIVTQPPDVVRTHMQVQPQGIFVAFRNIYRNHGISGFFRGVIPRISRRMISTAFVWTVYEQLTAFWHRRTHG